MEISTSIERYVVAVPKAELHVHLEGSIQPATLLTLAQRNSVQLPVQTEAEMQRWFTFRDFNHFIEIFFAISSCLKSAEDYELIAYEFGVEIRWVFDIVRDIPDRELNRLRAEYTVAVALEGMKDGVVALGLGGAEIGHPPEHYATWFEKALAAGLHSAPHAGETVGPPSIWGALQTLGAERIGHGVRSIEDPQLMAYLRDRQIPLEVCPTSNICLGVYADMSSHPFPRLYNAGIPISVHSDDPPLFSTTLNHEVALLFNAFTFDVNTANNILLNGVRHSFLSREEKQAMEAAFQQGMAQLQHELEL